MLGATIGLIVLLNKEGYFDKPPLKTYPNDWKPAYEQFCIEDGNTKKDCYCAITLVDLASPSAYLNGEVIHMETKEMLKHICL